MRSCIEELLFLEQDDPEREREEQQVSQEEVMAQLGGGMGE